LLTLPFKHLDMKKFFFYSFIALIPLSACSQKSDKEQSDAIKQIKVVELNQIDFAANPEFVLIDVRTTEEVNDGAIANSKHIDVLEQDSFKNAVQELDKSKTYYLYCRSGGRSTRAAEMMKAMGFENLYNVEGGITAWKGQGFPIE
jgi:rhodanese-related sulfurtransferase